MESRERATRGYNMKNGNNIKNREVNQIIERSHKENLEFIKTVVSQNNAITVLRLLPHLSKEVQNPRRLGEILKTSHETIRNWIEDYGHLILKEKGGEVS